jgi:hypothetical protein
MKREIYFEKKITECKEKKRDSRSKKKKWENIQWGLLVIGEECGRWTELELTAREDWEEDQILYEVEQKRKEDLETARTKIKSGYFMQKHKLQNS